MNICDTCKNINDCKYNNITSQLDNNINEGISNTPLTCSIGCKDYISSCYSISKPIGIRSIYNPRRRKTVEKIASAHLSKNEMEFKSIAMIKFNDYCFVLGYTFPVFDKSENCIDKIYFVFTRIEFQSWKDKWFGYTDSRFRFRIDGHRYNIRNAYICFNNIDIRGDITNFALRCLIHLLTKDNYNYWNQLCDLVYSHYKIPISIMPNYFERNIE